MNIKPMQIRHQITFCVMIIALTFTSTYSSGQSMYAKVGHVTSPAGGCTNGSACVGFDIPWYIPYTDIQVILQTTTGSVVHTYLQSEWDPNTPTTGCPFECQTTGFDGLSNVYLTDIPSGTYSLVANLITQNGNISVSTFLPNNTFTILTPLTSGAIIASIDSVHVPTDGCSYDGYIRAIWHYNSIPNSEDYCGPVVKLRHDGKKGGGNYEDFFYTTDNDTIIFSQMASQSFLQFTLEKDGFTPFTAVISFLAPAPAQEEHPISLYFGDYPLMAGCPTSITYINMQNNNECVDSAIYTIHNSSFSTTVVSKPGHNGSYSKTINIPAAITTQYYMVSSIIDVGHGYQAHYGSRSLQDTVIEGPPVNNPCDIYSSFQSTPQTKLSLNNGTITVSNTPYFIYQNDPTWTAYLHLGDQNSTSIQTQNGYVGQGLQFSNLKHGEYWVQAVFSEVDCSNNLAGICEKWIGPIEVGAPVINNLYIDTISGKLRSYPLNNALVQITDKSNNQIVQSEHSDNNGYFNLLELDPQRNYSISITADTLGNTLQYFDDNFTYEDVDSGIFLPIRVIQQTYQLLDSIKGTSKNHVLESIVSSEGFI